MDYRLGKCSQCGAEFKVPVSFVHDQARCKECSGVVNLGPPRNEQGTLEPQLEEVEIVNAEEKREARGTLAKLKAQRAGKRSEPETSPLLPDPEDLFDDFGSVDEFAEAEPEPVPREARRAESETRKPGAGAARTGARTEARTGTRSGARTPGRTARKRSGGGRKRGGQTKAKKNTGGLLLVGVLLAVSGAAAWYFLGGAGAGGLDGENVAEAAMPTAEQSKRAELEGSADRVASNPGSGGDSPPDLQGSPDPEVAEDGASASPFDKPAPAPKRGDPASVDLTAIEDCNPARGTTDEEWTELQALVVSFLDLDSGAAGPRAGRKLEQLGRKAYPALVNHMLTLDYSTEEGLRMGQAAQKRLQGICNGSNFDWADGLEPEDVYFNKKVVVAWAKTWKGVEKDIEGFIKVAKLDQVDPDEALRLRELYGE